MRNIRNFRSDLQPSGPPAPEGHRIAALRRAIGRLERTGLADEAHAFAFGIPALDKTLGGGIARGALHEVAAPGEAEIAAATGFAVAVAASAGKSASIVWIAEDMALGESGAPYGPGLDGFGLAPDRLIAVRVAKARDVPWAMEEALRCRAVGAVIGEVREARLGLIATRRLSLAAARGGVPAFLLRATPGTEASAAATRWVIGTAPAPAVHGPGPPRFHVRLTRNRRGLPGAWTLEWNCVERRFQSTLPEPVAEAALDRPHPAAA